MDYGNNLNKFQTNKKVFLEDSNYSENTKIKYWRVLNSTFVNLFEKTTFSLPDSLSIHRSPQIKCGKRP